MARFRSRFAGQFAILTLLLATAEGQASKKPSEAELAAITARGVLLAEYDTAAWQATDAVQAAHPVQGRVGRYIGRKTDAGWVVDFGRLNQRGVGVGGWKPIMSSLSKRIPRLARTGNFKRAVKSRMRARSTLLGEKT